MFSWEKDPVFCFSSDIDWASDEIIEFSHECLGGSDLRITYFNTHPSPYLNKLTVSGECRQLIHPNFLAGSSHGDSFEEVMEYCRQLVPDADGFRTHRYFEVNDIMDEYARRGFQFFSNHCTRCEPNIAPLHHRSGMVSLPIFLEDGCYLLMDPDLDTKNLKPRLETPGLKIINFHPAHMAFNTPYFAYTREIKDTLTREEWNNIDGDKLQTLSHSGNGVRNIIQFVAEYALSGGHMIRTLHEIQDEFRAGKGLSS